MIKIFLLLSAAMLAATAVFGVLNRNTFIAESGKTADAKKKFIVADQALAQIEENVQDKKAELKDAKDDRDQVDAKLTLSKENLMQKERSVKELEKTLQDENLKLKEFEVVLAKFKDDDGKIPSIQKLRDKQTALAEEVKSKKAEADAAREQTVAANKVVEAGENQIQAQVDKQKERAASFVRNGFEATITAVNSDWGFVIIDAGKDKGVKADSALLVSKADGTRVGKVNIISIEPAVTVADIDQDSLSGGAKIQPGYKVIYEDVAQ